MRNNEKEKESKRQYTRWSIQNLCQKQVETVLDCNYIKDHRIRMRIEIEAVPDHEQDSNDVPCASYGDVPIYEVVSLQSKRERLLFNLLLNLHNLVKLSSRKDRMDKENPPVVDIAFRFRKVYVGTCDLETKQMLCKMHGLYLQFIIRRSILLLKQNESMKKVAPQLPYITREVTKEFRCYRQKWGWMDCLQSYN
ncbi:hypothetical protein V6N12_013057 [Hibiscus sabdariffa]|uniref:Uncharacterized protein n=1 Tax=Hibiscus sabdariffa TaxID=183260 RepID=A0ABR2EG71_9ROSI